MSCHPSRNCYRFDKTKTDKRGWGVSTSTNNITLSKAEVFKCPVFAPFRVYYSIADIRRTIRKRRVLISNTPPALFCTLEDPLLTSGDNIRPQRPQRASLVSLCAQWKWYAAHAQNHGINKKESWPLPLLTQFMMARSFTGWLLLFLALCESFFCLLFLVLATSARVYEVANHYFGSFSSCVILITYGS